MELHCRQLKIWDCSERQRCQGFRSGFGFGNVESLEFRKNRKGLLRLRFEEYSHC